MKQIIVNHEHLQKRIAFVENGKVQEYYTEIGDRERIVGSIFKGRITNLEPSLQAAFIDIGLEKNAFLHYWDMVPATKEELERTEAGVPDTIIDYIDIEEEVEESQPPAAERKNAKSKTKKPSLTTKLLGFLFISRKPSTQKENQTPKRYTKPKPKPYRKPEKSLKKIDIEEIPKRFSVNSSVIVQVTKGPIGTKGPRVTTNLSIPGRYVVLLPNSGHIGISRRIDDREERQRLRDIIRRMNLPPKIGLICRTASTGLSEKALMLDIEILLEKWQKSQQACRQNKTSICIYEEPGLLETTIRDSLSEDMDEIIVDSKEAFELTQTYVKKLDRKDHTQVKFYDNPESIFSFYKLNDQIRQIYRRTVPLKSGAELCIDETEALIAIDINSKKSRKGKDHPETILNTNLEAADEIGRQLKLRNLGGLIVIDFIDMRSRKDRYTVYQRMKDILSRDRAKTKILPISKLGLIEMTRQREYESLLDATYQACSYCDGKGLIKSSITVSIEIQRQLQEMLRRRNGITKIRVNVHPSVLSRLKREDADILNAMEKEFGGDLRFRADPNIHQEEYHMIDMRTGAEIGTPTP